MELFHIHLQGVKDRIYKPGSEFIINPNNFNNRLYDKIYMANCSVKNEKYPDITGFINNYFMVNFNCVSPVAMNLGEIIGVALQANVSKQEMIRLLEDARDIIQPMGMYIREMAMEEYRIKNCPDKPSRLHSLYACDESAMNYWADRLMDGTYDVLKIDVDDNTFVSNEQFFPPDEACYGDKVLKSHRYFHPKARDIENNKKTCEYLVQGKVRVLEKVDELKRDIVHN